MSTYPLCQLGFVIYGIPHTGILGTKKSSNLFFIIQLYEGPDSFHLNIKLLRFNRSPGMHTTAKRNGGPFVRAPLQSYHFLESNARHDNAQGPDSPGVEVS